MVLVQFCEQETGLTAFSAPSPLARARRYFVGDFNGDGAADIALLRSDGHWFIVNGRDGSPQGA